MNDLEVPVLTVIVWLGAALVTIVGAASHLLNSIAKAVLVAIAKLNRRLGNKGECFRYASYSLSGLEICKYAAGIVVATLSEDDSPPLRTKDDEEPISAPGQSSAELLSQEERAALSAHDDSSAGEGQEGSAGEERSSDENPDTGEQSSKGSVAYHSV